MVLCSIFLNFNAQSSLGMTYQAVIRNASNNLITNSPVGVKISIRKSTPTGAILYSETHTPTTNANGLATFIIGAGTVVSGDYGTIDWGGNTYYLQTETDPTGGTSYSISNTSQLMSVPYALYSERSGNAWQSDGNLANTADYIGTRNATDIVFKRDNLESMRITNTGIEIAKEIKPGGTAGLNGQVLQSNGNGTMSWKNMPYNNNTRFAVHYTDTSATFSGFLPLQSILYNLNPTDININVAANTLTINKSGLYHFDVSFISNVVTSVNPTDYPLYFTSLVAGNGYTIYFDNFQPIKSDNSLWRALGTSSLDVHITAPTTLRFSYSYAFINSKNTTVDITCYLISE